MWLEMKRVVCRVGLRSSMKNIHLFLPIAKPTDFLRQKKKKELRTSTSTEYIVDHTIVLGSIAV